MKTLNEFLQEVENLNEISKATLASYIKKGSADAVERMGDASRAGMSGRRKEADKGYDKAHKRVSGVRTAATKLQYKKEEVVHEGEVLDEADPRLAIYQSGMTDASRVKGPVGKAVDKVKDKVKKVLGKKDKVSSHLDRYRFQSGLDNYLKSKVKKEEVANEDYYSGTGEKVQKRTKAWMGKQKPPIKGAPGLDAMKAREAEHKAKRGVKKEEVVTERLGGKGYKARTDSRGIKVSGDWEDSDRGAGNKAKKRAGGKVEKKSPTYQAHVLHKEDKALAFVIDKLRKQYPGGVLTKGDKMPEPSAAQKKKNAEIRAQRAKEDGRDETEKATSGRYNDRSRSD